MKSNSIIGMAIMILLSNVNSYAQIKHAQTSTMKVFGNTASEQMIEKAGSGGRLAKVDWNGDTKMATITYDATKTSADEVLKRIALAGFDSEKFLAPDDAYAKLAQESQYVRTLKPVSEHQHHEHETHSTTNNSSEHGTQLALVTSRYFVVKDALVKDDAKTSAASAQKLLDAIQAVDMNKLSSAEHTVWMKVMNNLRKYAADMTKAKDIAGQRLSFASLSNNIYALVKVAKLETQVYYQHCPMFNDGKGGHWLSKENGVKNPFFGAKMLSCGSTVETIN